MIFKERETRDRSDDSMNRLGNPGEVREFSKEERYLRHNIKTSVQDSLKKNMPIAITHAQRKEIEALFEEKGGGVELDKEYLRALCNH